MIARMWRCSTTPQNAEPFEAFVRSDILPRLEQIKGFISGQLLRRDLLEEVEFVGVTYFDSLESLRAMAGDDIGELFIPESAVDLLIQFDKRASLFTVILESDNQVKRPAAISGTSAGERPRPQTETIEK